VIGLQWWKPYELRGSRTVLREAGSEIPRPTHRVLTQAVFDKYLFICYVDYSWFLRWRCK